MQQQSKTSAPNAQYMRQPANTGGFFGGGFDNPLDYSAPATKPAKGVTVYEPSPICAVGGVPALFSGGSNLLLHVLCVICTTMAASKYLPPHDKTDIDEGVNFTPNNENDFVRSWVVVMITCEWLCVVFTVVYYGCVYKAMSLPLAGHVGLGLQLCATMSAVKLSYWVAVAPGAAKDMRDKQGDGWIVATMYLGLFVIAGYIMTPISGNYYKIVNNSVAGKTAQEILDMPKDTWAPPKV